MAVTLRTATIDDLPLLARMNKHLIEDQRSGNPMTVDQLAQRMQEWLDTGRCSIELFELDGEPIGYAAYAPQPADHYFGGVCMYVRQYFIDRQHRNRGLGAQCMRLLIDQRFGHAKILELSVLETNADARRFYERLGFVAYCTTLRLAR